MRTFRSPATRQDFPWRRYWVSSDDTGSAPSAGFLAVLPERYAAFSPFKPHTLDELQPYRCALLLGEPGAGKSRALASHARSHPHLLLLNLKEYRDAEAVAQAIERSAAFVRWQEGGDLHLALDSFDELQLRDPGLAGGLLRHLRGWLGGINDSTWEQLLTQQPASAGILTRLVTPAAGGWTMSMAALTGETLLPDDVRAAVVARLPVARCTLRVACRPGELPGTLREGLHELFAPVGGAATFRLAPLRFEDARTAAALSGLDGDAFMAAVTRQDVEVLAANPSTLDLLLTEFAGAATLPDSQSELFHRACLRLCAEPDENRDRQGSYSPVERLVAAARLAFLATFSNHETITLGEASSVALSVVSALGDDRAHGRALDVVLPLLRSALSSGVFAGVGEGIFGWRHRRYREYLAAWYVQHRALPLAQVRSLLLHPGDGRVVPQLAEVASFLASGQPDVLGVLLEADPLTLLRSDLGLCNSEVRTQVVGALLGQFDRGNLVQSDRGLKPHLRKLAHPGLATQVRPVIVDARHNHEVRWFAIDVAEASDLVDLVPDLLGLALDRRENHHLRQEAARTITLLQDEASVRALRPLALEQGEDDPDDQLKGIALLALWPRFLTAEELFGVLNWPKVGNFFGSYKLFLGGFVEEGEWPAFVAELRDEDMPRALEWAREHSGRRNSTQVTAQAADAVMSRASGLLHRDGIAYPFADIVLARWAQYAAGVGASVTALETRFLGALETDSLTRRRLLTLLFERAENHPQAGRPWRAFSRGYARPEDVTWLVAFARQAPEAPARAALQVAAGLLDWNDVEARERWRTLGREWPLARGVLDVDDLEAAINQAQQDERELRAAEPPVPPPPVEEVLRTAEAGLEPSTWLALLHRIQGEEALRRPFDLAVCQTELWSEADDAFRERVRRLAAQFLHEQDAPPLERLVQPTKFLRDFAAVGAVQLLDEGAPGTVPDAWWSKWAGVVLMGGDGSDSAAHQRLVERAYHAAPEALLRAALAQARAEAQNHGTVFVTRTLRGVWDDRLDEAFSALLRGRHLGRAWGGVLYELLERGSVRAREVARRAARQASHGTERGVEALRVLLARDFESAWPLFWRLAERHPNEALSALSAYVNVLHGADLLSRLHEEQAADFYLWLEARVPYAEDPQRTEGAYMADARDDLVRLRDELLRTLKGRGTRAACDALARVRRARPDLAWLKWTHLEALAEWRRRTWMWSTPEALLRLVARAERRLVRSDDDLLEAVLESLERLEGQLVRQETPLAEFLWNTWTDEQKCLHWEPKDEEALSNWVKHHLQADLVGRGVVVGREVEVRRGQYTDVHVTALRATGAGTVGDPVKVIVEVKGHWYGTLLDNLQTQLADRYLGAGEVRCGVYLVGWYNSPLWKERTRKTWTAERLRRDLDERAVAASVDGRRVVARLIDVCPPQSGAGRRQKS